MPNSVQLVQPPRNPGAKTSEQIEWILKESIELNSILSSLLSKVNERKAQVDSMSEEISLQARASLQAKMQQEREIKSNGNIEKHDSGCFAVQSIAESERSMEAFSEDGAEL